MLRYIKLAITRETKQVQVSVRLHLVIHKLRNVSGGGG